MLGRRVAAAGAAARRSDPVRGHLSLGGESWKLTTRFEGTDRLVAHAHSIPDAPLMDAASSRIGARLYGEISADDDSFDMFGFTIHLSQNVVWLESRIPLRTLPDSQHAALVEPGWNAGSRIRQHSARYGGRHRARRADASPAFHQAHRDSVRHRSHPGRDAPPLPRRPNQGRGGRLVRHRPVEIKGQVFGTAHVPVALVDASFERVFATGRSRRIRSTPRSSRRFRKMRQIRKDR